MYGCLPVCNQGFHPACISYTFLMIFHYVDTLVKNVFSFEVDMIIPISLWKCFVSSQNFHLEVKTKLRGRVPGGEMFYSHI